MEGASFLAPSYLSGQDLSEKSSIVQGPNSDIEVLNSNIMGLRKRQFTVKCVTSTEALVFPQIAIDQMKRDFKITSNDFYKEMIRQTYKLLHFQLKAI